MNAMPPLPAIRMLSPKEAAAYCGGKSVQWLQAHVRVAPTKIGAKILYDVRQLDKWLDDKAKSISTPVTGDDWLGKLDEGEGDGD